MQNPKANTRNREPNIRNFVLLQRANCVQLKMLKDKPPHTKSHKASPKIWALNNFKEFEAWFKAYKKELEAEAESRKTVYNGKRKTAAKLAA